MTRSDRFKVALASWLVRGLLALLGATWRWRVVGAGADPTLLFARPAILAYWHDRTLPMAHFAATRWLARGHHLGILTSLSRDGELGARLSRSWGATVYRGSASRGGTAGLRKLFRHLRQGGSCILAPDGPRGPIYQAKPGVVVLSQMTGAPVIPLGVATDRGWHLRSWDRMVVPKPFARIWVVVGEPETLAAGSDLAAGQSRVAARLDEVRDQAKVLAGAGGSVGSA